MILELGVTRAFALLLVLAFLLSGGCQTKQRLSETNDQLRLERESLREIVQRQEGEIAELKAKISELTSENAGAPSEAIVAAMPRVAKVEVARSSRIERTEAGPVAVFFVRTLDGRGRFVQGVGELSLRVTSTGAAGAEPSVVASETLDPNRVRASYTAGFGGTAYMVRVPIDSMPEGPLVFSATYSDLTTSVTHSAERLVRE